MKINIVIVHYGDLNDTFECLNSLDKLNKSNYELDVVIVNNTTDKNISDELQSHKNVSFVLTPHTNLGFAEGNNLAIKNIKNTDYFLLINNDTKINDKNIINKLINVFDKEANVGIVAPIIKFINNGHILYDCGGYLNKITGISKHQNLKEIVSSNKFIKPDYVSGCAMMIKNSLINQIGGFDSKFFLYMEDIDFSLKAKKLGYKIIINPNAKIFHKLNNNKNIKSIIYIWKYNNLIIKRYIKIYYQPFSFLYSNIYYLLIFVKIIIQKIFKNA